MVVFEAHSWVRLSIGLIAGCWIGVAVGCAITMLLTGRRLQQLETANLLLRVKLRAKEKNPLRTRSGSAGPTLVLPPAENRPASAPLRAAGGR